MAVRKRGSNEHVARRYARNRAAGLCRCGRAREEERFKLCARCRQWIRERYTPKHGRLMPAEEWFWSYVDKSGECWTWEGSRHPKGYGQVYFKGRQRIAHRVSWEMANGLIPAGLMVCHRCDNPPCVRPDHLFLGTAKDNTADMQRKGRGKLFPRVPHGEGVLHGS